MRFFKTIVAKKTSKETKYTPIKPIYWIKTNKSEYFIYLSSGDLEIVIENKVMPYLLNKTKKILIENKNCSLDRKCRIVKDFLINTLIENKEFIILDHYVIK